jgi:hypothetical protein
LNPGKAKLEMSFMCTVQGTVANGWALSPLEERLIG